MSRSFKKTPMIKDRGFQKNEANKRLRRVTKPIVKHLDKESDSVILPDTSEITNDYNVCDWKFLVDKDQLNKMSEREQHKIKGK